MLARKLEAILSVAAYQARSDGELLARFLELDDEAAFQTLLIRHTPMVRAVCRGWLRETADIDDAAQSTFLVLVQRARSIRDPARLPAWLYRVANRVARRLRGNQLRWEPLSADLPGSTIRPQNDVEDLVHAEVARLPEKYRLPVQLCYSAGLTTAEAARRLGWPKGTVLTRLAWARARLQAKLGQRGVTVAALASLAGVSAAEAGWVRTTVRCAMELRVGALPPAAGATMTLAKGVVQTMARERLSYTVLTAILVVGSIGFGLRQWAVAGDGPNNAPRVSAEPTTRGSAPTPTPDANDPRGDNPKIKPTLDGDRKPLSGRRREAVIRLPAGTFVKEVDASDYGSGRISWNYEDDRVLGSIEGNVMGVEFELATEAEYSLSSNGTIYGLLTSVRLIHIKLPTTGELAEASAEVKPFLGLWPLAEPLINDLFTDLPFSYQSAFRGIAW